MTADLEGTELAKRSGNGHVTVRKIPFDWQRVGGGGVELLRVPLCGAAKFGRKTLFKAN